MDRFADTTANESRAQPGSRFCARLHPHCVICSQDNPSGLGLRFLTGPDDTVTAQFELDQTVEGYIGWGRTAVLRRRFSTGR